MNNHQLELIEEKYGKLIHKIGHWISGDEAISSHDDNTQDIWIAAMEAIRGYEKKENLPFEDFWGTPGFDKYIKTCLWNVKNSKGSRITKRFGITRNTVEIMGNEEVLQMEDPTQSPESQAFVEELHNILNEQQKTIVMSVLDDPSTLKESGKININMLSKKLGLSWNEISIQVKDLGRKLSNEL
tara:strand:+ start:732 stop:1286 length:555 start_codon:yes stop_codon:yes gene_type:complete